LPTSGWHDLALPVEMGMEINSMNRATNIAELTREHNMMAAVLSLMLPGLGHLYKAHYLRGAFLIVLGIPIAVWAGILLGLATAGLGLLLPIGYWAGIATDAYYTDDRRRHHFGMNLL
jgi:uncharacterized membrane protein